MNEETPTCLRGTSGSNGRTTPIKFSGCWLAHNSTDGVRDHFWLCKRGQQMTHMTIRKEQQIDEGRLAEERWGFGNAAYSLACSLPKTLV